VLGIGERVLVGIGKKNLGVGVCGFARASRVTPSSYLAG
jgi:hypothetical protein